MHVVLVSYFAVFCLAALLSVLGAVGLILYFVTRGQASSPASGRSKTFLIGGGVLLALGLVVGFVDVVAVTLQLIRF